MRLYCRRFFLIGGFKGSGAGKIGEAPDDDGPDQNDSAHAFKKKLAAFPHVNDEAFGHGHPIGGQFHDKWGIAAFEKG